MNWRRALEAGLTITFIVVGIVGAAYFDATLNAEAWTQDGTVENDKMHYFACGYLWNYDRKTYDTVCEDVAATAAKHGWK